MAVVNRELARRLFRNRLFSETVFFGERIFKEIIFDCQSCGQCVLSHTGFICPMRCPKQLRNGACGGANQGFCEVRPDRRCVWDEIWESVSELSRTDDLRGYEPPVDWRLYGTSAWENMFEDRIPGEMKFFVGSESALKQSFRLAGHMLRLWYRRVTGPSWGRGEALQGRPFAAQDA
jgi:hypothetical protein